MCSVNHPVKRIYIYIFIITTVHGDNVRNYAIEIYAPIIVNYDELMTTKTTRTTTTTAKTVIIMHNDNAREYAERKRYTYALIIYNDVYSSYTSSAIAVRYN